MAKLTFENFQGQIEGSDFVSQHLLLKGKVGEFTKSIIDPNRLPGVLSPFPLAVDLTNNTQITTTVTKMVPWITDDPLVFAGGGAKIYQITGDTITNDADFPHTITGTTPVVSDMIVYENNGTFEVFYSFNDNTNGVIGRLSAIDETSGTADTFDDNYWQGTVGGSHMNKNYPHSMAIADNNMCYIANGSVLAKMDLTTGAPAATDTAVDVLGGWIIKNHISHKGYHWIAARETHTAGVTESSIDTRITGRCAIFVWDYVKSTFDEIYYLEDSDIYRIFLYAGELHVITGNGMSTNKLRKFNGTTFDVVPGVIYGNQNEVTLGGIAERQGMIMWGSEDNGEVYTYGGVGMNSKKFNIIGDIGADCSAIIQKPQSTDTFFLSSDNAVQKFDFSVGGGYSNDVATFISSRIDFPQNAKIQEFRVYFPDIEGNVSGSGGATKKLQLDAYFNGFDSNQVIGTVGSDKNSRGYVKFGYIKSDVYSINVGFRYTGGTVAVNNPTILPYKIEVIYELTDKR